MVAETRSSSAREHQGWQFYLDVLLRSLALLVVLNLLFATLKPGTWLAKASAYNLLFPGRLRLPYGENPEQDYNLSLFSMEAMFASHVIAGEKKSPSEFRVLFIGDSSTWGFLLPPDVTVAAWINKQAVVLPGGRAVRAYNLGYPVMSLAKDLLILTEALDYEPDLIVWPVTLESFPADKQLTHPLLLHNPDKIASINDKYALDLDLHSAGMVNPTFWDRTIVGSRRFLADLVRLQLLGVLWAATGVDHYIPSSYTARQEDLEADNSFHGLSGPAFAPGDLAFDLLNAGQRIAGQVPVLLVNEPMFISHGQNSDIRYNFYYPRWAFDDYRAHLHRLSQENGWLFLDLWDAVKPDQFSNSAVHLTSEGTQQFAHRLLPSIIEIAGRKLPATEE